MTVSDLTRLDARLEVQVLFISGWLKQCVLLLTRRRQGAAEAPQSASETREYFVLRCARNCLRIT